MQASLHNTYSEPVGMSIISSHPGLMKGQAPAFLMDWRERAYAHAKENLLLAMQLSAQKYGDNVRPKLRFEVLSPG